MIYIISFIFILICNLIASLLNNKNIKLIVYFLSMLLLTYILIFRYRIGWDWEVYNYFFNNIVPITNNDFSITTNNYFNWEAGFVLISSFFAIFLKNQYFIYSLFFMLMIIFFVYKFLKQDSYLFVIPFTFFGYIDSFSVIRQEVALSFLIAGLYYFSINRYSKFIFFSLMAVLFHYSVLFIIILFLIIVHFRIYRYVLIIIILSITIIASSLLNEIITYIFNFFSLYLNEGIRLKLEEYLTMSYLNNTIGFSLRYVELIILSILPLLFKNVYDLEKDKKLLVIYIMVLINIIIYTIFNSLSIFWERFAVYSWIFEAIYIGYILKNIKLMYKVFLSLMIYFTIIVHHYQYWNSPERLNETNFSRFYPYKSILSEEIMYEK